ncbi:hypothetical protein M3795_25050 [Ralstonia pickettii]|uniref:hypothetical protein n=1 Tax=Ralstonia pickettii TaxID=329 RepID=UPI00203E1B0D|nr:hypothetical protein [Ralstonia pickettii]MCM3583741.1 hypothetical protein [Ralstonia pickettii]
MKKLVVSLALGSALPAAMAQNFGVDETALEAAVAQARAVTVAKVSAPVVKDKRTIVSGERFKCVLETPLKPSALADDRLLACLVLDDVYSRSNKKTVIPRGSKLVGSFKKDRVFWFGWATPDGYSVNIDLIAHEALVSPVPSDLPSELQVVATRDIQIEFPANSKP